MVTLLPDDTNVLYLPENDEGGPDISLCSNPPDGLEQYIKKHYIYWLNGNFCTNKGYSQFSDYLHSNLADGEDVELWSLWIGRDGIESGIHYKRNLDQLNGELLKLLYETECCIHMTK